MKIGKGLKTTGNARKQIGMSFRPKYEKPGLPGIGGETETTGIAKMKRRKPKVEKGSC